MRQEKIMMMKPTFWLLALGLMSAPAFADNQHTDQAMNGASKQGIHQGKGKVVSVDKAKATVKLAHEPIKSLGWPGMTMDFTVANAALLKGLKAGDAVTFDLGQGSKPGEWPITRITPQ